MRESGQILVFVIVIVGVVLMTTITTIGGAQLYHQNTNYSMEAEKAIALAEAGLDKAVASLNKTGGTYSGEAETTFGDGSYSVTITDLSSVTKTIIATGYIPNKSKVRVKRTVSVQASKGIGAAFKYGVQVGEGGLVMNNNSEVRGLGGVSGSVYSNGNITMANGAKITGDAFVAGGTQPTADQEYDCSVCTDFIFGKNVGGENRLDVAQSFKPSTTQAINKLSLKLKKIGSPSNLTVRILGDNSGNPNKNNVLTFGILSASLVSSSYSFVDVVFNPAVSLTAGNTYWIVLDTSSDNSNYWSWQNDSSQGYNGGVPKWSDNWQTGNPTWNLINPGDLSFKTYMGGIPTKIKGAPNAHIFGNAYANTLEDLNIGKDAYYQVENNITVSGSNCNNNTHCHPNSTDPVSQVMPLSDTNIEQWKLLAENNGVQTGDITTCPSSLPSAKYIGNVSLPGNCTVTVDSPIWITGTLSLSNSDTIKLNPDFKAASGALITDGQVTIDTGNKILGSGTAGSYLMLISNFNSRDDPVKRVAINFTNNGNSGIVYSNLGTVNITNNNTLTEVTAWKLTLGNNVIVEYDQGLAGAFFSSGPSGSFSLIKGSYQVK